MNYTYYNNVNYKEISKKENVSILVAKAIEAYNLSLDKDTQLANPYDYSNMNELVGYLHKAIFAKKKIVVYGDYDVDGICSVSILKRMFDLLGLEIGYYIPNRYKDGYGLNNTKVQEIALKNYDIIICIDNGINAKEAINLAKSKNMDVIVLDHHELIDDLPNCDYYLHPIISNFSTYNMCASSVAYYLSIAMLAQNDDKCAILAGIATLSDVMPLIGQNKLLVKNALKLLNKHIYKNLDLLIDDKEYNESILTMSLIPKLNSVGRIVKDNKANLLIKFLLESDENTLMKYVKFILECNKTRKDISEHFFNELNIDFNKKIIIVKDDALIEGVCGIIASRLANSYDVPAICFARSEDGNYYKGSARSVEGINIVEMLSKLDYLVNFGGHEKAAGLTISVEDYQRFSIDMEKLISLHQKKESSKEVILIEENELGYKEYLELLKYGPFGEANPYPIFALSAISKDKVTFSKDKKHLIIKLNNDVTLLGFNLANKYEEKYNNYEAIFTLDKNNLLKNKLSCKCIEIKGGK